MTQNTKAMQKQPKIIYLICLIEFVQKFSYWGLQSVLVLFFIKQLFINAHNAYKLYGALTGLAFSMSIVGGYLNDRFSNYKFSIISSIILTAFGFLILYFQNQMYALGLSFIIFGAGLYSANMPNFLGTFYQTDNSIKHNGFTLLYIGTNLGGFFGPIIYGLIAKYFNWSISFSISATLLFITGILLSIGYGKNNVQNQKNNHNFLFLLIGFIVILICWVLLKKIYLVKIFFIILAIGIFLFLLNIFLYSPKNDKKDIFYIFSLILLTLVFFAFELQVDSSLLIFSEKYVNRFIFSWQLPTPVFAAFEPLSVIFCAPLLIRCWKYLNKINKEPVVIGKAIISLFLASLGFFLFMIAARIAANTNMPCSMLWVIFGSLFLGAGEVTLMPMVLSTINSRAPTALKSTITGSLYLALAFSGIVAGFIAGFTATNPEYLQKFLKNQAIIYANVYGSIFYISISLAFILLICAALIKKYIARLYKNK